MDWETIVKYGENDAFVTLDGKRTRVKITGVNVEYNGSKWISLSFYENHELTPAFYGMRLGNCNVIHSPENRRNVRGHRSEEIIKSLELLDSKKEDVKTMC